MNKCLLLLLVFLIPFCSPQKDWIIQDTGISDGIYDIEIVDDKTGYAYSYGTGKLLKTSNGGQSWNQIAQFDSIFFEQIQFIDKNNGYLCGENNTIMKTSDGAHKWENCKINQEPGNILIYGMYFIDIQQGFAAAIRSEEGKFVSKIYQTNDGARTWKLINEVPHMILNMEKVEGEIWGSGHGVILRNIDRHDQWIYSFTDSSRLSG